MLLVRVSLRLPISSTISLLLCLPSMRTSPLALKIQLLAASSSLSTVAASSNYYYCCSAAPAAFCHQHLVRHL